MVSDDLKKRVAEWKAQRDFFEQETCNAIFADVVVGERFQVWQGGQVYDAYKEAPVTGGWGAGLRATNACINGKSVFVRDETPVKVFGKRLVAIGNRTGVTAVAAEWQEQLEAERREMADYDATMDAASNRFGY